MKMTNLASVPFGEWDAIAARKVREDAGLSQAEVAQRVGVSDATVSRWEAGLYYPSGRVLLRYMGVLDQLRRTMT